MTATFTSETFVPDALIAGNAHLLTGQKITLAAGENLKRGAVLGKVSASGEYKLSVAGASDGSEVPDAVLAEDTDATSAAAATVAYIRGDFNETALILGTGHTADSIREGLRAKGIILIKPVAA